MCHFIGNFKSTIFCSASAAWFGNFNLSKKIAAKDLILIFKLGLNSLCKQLQQKAPLTLAHIHWVLLLVECSHTALSLSDP
jgi:hypothetical protein